MTRGRRQRQPPPPYEPSAPRHEEGGEELGEEGRQVAAVAEEWLPGPRRRTPRLYGPTARAERGLVAPVFCATRRWKTEPRPCCDQSGMPGCFYYPTGAVVRPKEGPQHCTRTARLRWEERKAAAEEESDCLGYLSCYYELDPDFVRSLRGPAAPRRASRRASLAVAAVAGIAVGLVFMLAAGRLRGVAADIGISVADGSAGAGNVAGAAGVKQGQSGGAERGGQPDRRGQPPPVSPLLQSPAGHAEETRTSRRQTYEELPAVVAVARHARRFRAYDCSEPANLTAMSLLDKMDVSECDNIKLQRRQKKTKKYLLLQKVQRVKTVVKWCRARTYRIAYNCQGTYSDRTAMMPREWRFDEPWSLKLEECQSMHQLQNGTRKLFYNAFHSESYGTDNNEVPVEMNATNRLVLNRAGYTWHSGGEAKCWGAEMGTEHFRYLQNDARGDEIMYNAMIMDHVIMDLYEKEAVINTDPVTQNRSLFIPDLGLELHCPYEQGNCTTQTQGTFMWEVKKKDDFCPYFKTKEVSGIQLSARDSIGDDQAEEEDGDEARSGDTFIATNGTMLRVRRIGKPISVCGGVVFETSYPDIYLSEEFSHKPFQRQIPPSEANPFLHSIMGDHYIYERIQDNLERSLLSLQRKQCRKKKEMDLRSYA